MNLKAQSTIVLLHDETVSAVDTTYGEKRETKVQCGIENWAFIFVFFKCQKCLSS